MSSCGELYNIIMTNNSWILAKESQMLLLKRILDMNASSETMTRLAMSQQGQATLTTKARYGIPMVMCTRGYGCTQGIRMTRTR